MRHLGGGSWVVLWVPCMLLYLLSSSWLAGESCSQSICYAAGPDVLAWPVDRDLFCAISSPGSSC
jgi:hypothetical protein